MTGYFLMGLMMFGMYLSCLIMWKESRYMIGVGCFIGSAWNILVICAYPNASLMEHLVNLLSVFVFWVGISFILHLFDRFYNNLLKLSINPDVLNKKR